MRRWLLALLVCAASTAGAHPLAPSLLQVREEAGGRVEVTWKTPAKRVPGSRLRPEFPPECTVLTEEIVEMTAIEVVTRWRLECGGALVGRRFRVADIAASKANVLVRVELADGRRVLQVLRPGTDTLVVPEREPATAVLESYGRLGVEHILTGVDHLCFVFGLLLLVGGGRRLLWTVTAFTVGHSVTLSLAALGFVDFPSRPIEILIAASIYVLALELLRARPSVLARRPWMMASGFGLLHGLGFAGALAEVGLPSGDIPLALLAFNLGIEAGQIGFVLAVLAAALLGRSLFRGGVVPRTVPAYAIGSLAAYWMLERALALGG